MSYVPVVDLDRDPAVVGRELDDVCRNVGFFQVIGHGVADAVADRAWAAMIDFFNLPLPDRMSVAAPAGYPYGYIPFSGESLAASLGVVGRPDLKEAFGIGPLRSLSSPKRSSTSSGTEEEWSWQPNLWPDALPELREAWTQYFGVMLELGSTIMGLFARGLGLDAGYFATSIDRSPSSLRGIRYPSRSVAELVEAPGGQLRAGAHTDYGTLTVLKQDTVGGLQVLDQQDAWADVESIDGAFVINIGDLMAQWTNDRWRSTLHRVVDPPTTLNGSVRQRHSMPFFHNANWDAVVAALPGTGSPRHEPVLAGPHLRAKFAAANSRAGRAS
jgi:isopenicillin N synthase-like dioxygenase